MTAHRDTARRRRRLWWLLAYPVLLLLSHLVQNGRERPPLPDRPILTLPGMSSDGPIDERSTRLTYLRFDAPGEHDPNRPVVVCIHGAPGDASNFIALAEPLTRAGYTVYALDMPGHGGSSRDAPSQSLRAQARTTLAAMDELGLDRVHAVGWSNGGGAVLHLADLAPDRVATVTLVASIGMQETEGSGSHAVEHLKYAIGFALIGGLPDLLPHFGRLGTRDDRVSWLWSFWDSDQRTVTEVMRRLTTPCLIIHGRADFLIADWAAERHHRVLSTSRLVMMDGMHFLPWTQTDAVAHEMVRLFDRHRVPGVEPLTDYDDRAPRRRPLFGQLSELPRRLLLGSPWWVGLLAIAIIAFVNPYVALALCAFVIPGNVVDYLVAFMGLLVGRGVCAVRLALWHGAQAIPIAPGSALRRGVTIALGHPPVGPDARTLGSMPPSVWAACAITSVLRYGALLLVVLAFIPGLLRPPAYPGGWPVAVLVFIGTAVALSLLSRLVTWRGRRGIRAGLARTLHHEWWPVWLFYVPLVPYVAAIGLRARGLMLFTCCNPGIEAGGGIAGESKSRIMERLGDSRESIATVALVEAGPSPVARAEQAVTRIDNDDSLGGYPVILKPDTGERGYGVRLVRSPSGVRAYFRSVPEAVVIQRYIEGPEEAGILWSRRPRTETGFIFSVTRKEMPVVVGDGVATLERLILTHRRYRCQAPVFLRRHEPDLSRIPASGERVVLGAPGNHAQGTLFRDGADLITPELERAINDIALRFRNDDGSPGGFDIGRFDIRYTRDEALRAGREFHVIELNGTLSESSNLYDPGRSPIWAYGWLFRHWRLMFRLGAERARAGARPMRLREVLRLNRQRIVRPELRVSD